MGIIGHFFKRKRLYWKFRHGTILMYLMGTIVEIILHDMQTAAAAVRKTREVKTMKKSKYHMLTIHFYPFTLKREASNREIGLVEIELFDNKGEIQRKECFITEDAKRAGDYIKEKYIDDDHFQWNEKGWKRKSDGVEIVFSERSRL